MNLAFLLHIYQPPTQEGRVIKQVAESCYIPLIKTLKNHPEAKFTLNIPLSLLAHLHANGYEALIQQIKTLYEEERIELVSTGAYHPLLTKLPEDLVEMQIILNEYGIGYYLGKNKGFEGEDALMLKNVTGFFPPELAVNETVVRKVSELGYSWMLVDEVALDKGNSNNTVFSLDGINTKIVSRNTGLSNLISFKRDNNIDDFVHEVNRLKHSHSEVVIALDGEFFGHHNPNGIYLLTTLMDKLRANGVNLVTMSDLVEKADEARIKGIVESTWAASPTDIVNKNIYPMWDVPENEIQQLQWVLFNTVVSLHQEGYIQLPKDIIEPGQPFETFPIWDFDALEKIQEVALKNRLLKTVLFMQSLSSDQFWWASKEAVGGHHKYDPGFIRRSLEAYVKFALITQDQDFITKVQEITDKIEKHL